MQAFRKKTFVVFVVAAILAACAPGQSPEQIQSQVETSVAMTVQAQNGMGTAVAQTVAAQAPAATETLTPTTIPLEVPTLTPILDTSTPFTVVPPSGGGGGGGGGGGSSGSSGTKTKYHCAIVGQVPRDGSPATILKVGDTLNVKWTFKNDGTKTWDPTWTWEFYSSQIDTNVGSNFGLTMSSAGSQHSLGVTVQKTQTITLGVFLTAPDFEGREPIRIGTAWSIIGDGVKFCIADINVEIIRPGMTP